MRIFLYVLVGVGIGSISGTLGIGGGVLLIPALIWLFDFQYPRAAGTTLAILAFPIGLWPAVWKHYEQGSIKADDLTAACWIAVGFGIGAYVGSSLVPYLSESSLKLNFGLLLLYIGARFVLHARPEVSAALTGLGTAAVAWLVYVGLGFLGERHLAKPDLGDKIRQAQLRQAEDPDYSI